MPVAVAQRSRAELEQQRQEILRDLEAVNTEYNKVRKNQKADLNQLALVQERVRLSNREIGNINAQIEAVNDTLRSMNGGISRLQGRLGTIKADYAQTLTFAYKSRNSFDLLNFIFSAANFNDAMRRLEYLKSYRTNRERQLAEIIRTEGLLHQKAREIADANAQKGEALASDKKARSRLEEEMKEKGAVAAELKSRERELSLTISNKRSSLDNIAMVIHREVGRRALNAPISKPALKHTRFDALPASDEDIKMEGAFKNNRGRLPWPVNKGHVVAHYGENKIDGTGITYFNPGTTIDTDPASPVYAIFDGQVSSIKDVAGKNLVIIRHGHYFTSYGNLSSVSVSQGDKLHAGDVIGRVAAGTDTDNGELEFILTEDLSGLDPELWLRPGRR